MNRPWLFAIGTLIVLLATLDFMKNVLPKMQGGMLDLRDLFRLRSEILTGMALVVASLVMLGWRLRQ